MNYLPSLKSFLTILFSFAGMIGLFAQDTLCTSNGDFPAGQNTGWVVPQGVTSINVDVTGADGGGMASFGVLGGTGANVTATYAVSPDDSLNIVVGAAPADPNSSTSGGGGSAIYNVTTNTLLVVAGAGGGAGTIGGPGRGAIGTSNGNGVGGASPLNNGGGGGGTTSMGGSGSGGGGEMGQIAGGAGGTGLNPGTGGFGWGGGGSGDGGGGGGDNGGDGDRINGGNGGTSYDSGGSGTITDGEDNMATGSNGAICISFSAGGGAGPATIPTMSEWGIFLFGLIVFTVALVAGFNLKKRSAININ